MITYPMLKSNAVIGVTAPSSGVPQELHGLLKQATGKMESRGYTIITGETAWTQEKAKSAHAAKRSEEFNQMMQDDRIDFILPPWGGELAMEMLEGVDYDAIKEKWILGYSDVSVLTLAITLKTGMATAHGTNLIDLRGESSDPITAMWETVLKTERGGKVTQTSSQKYQKEWQHENPTPHVYHLTEPTVWKTVSGQAEQVKGRLLGGCIDVIKHLAGTPLGDVKAFSQTHIGGDPILWYFENCALTATDLRISLVQLKMAGWFENCSGILFGRSPANHPVEGYTAEDVYEDLASELGVPVIYDIDCGHQPPQLTLINGAFAEVTVENGKGIVVQEFR
ncbi:S66 family peptidase [Metabacillus indicus]|uniref:Peptidase S66 n=1 Tax=Metabacillus indicus TaxID=246786 RepID=A0A084H216_METID|nr:S66 peptidase family protein [Metabacillus indicus]KEZ53628.1 peptidase S66 [Metabacillus indicus]